MANLCLEVIEELALAQVTTPPKKWFRYVDDDFSIIKKHALDSFHNLLNSIDPDINFTVEHELTAIESMPFNRFSTLPLKTCLSCERSLTMKNFPAKVKIFTMDGPLPCSKITLECRSCSCVYDFSDKLKMHFYLEEMQIDLVEVSNVTYLDLELYK